MNVIATQYEGHYTLIIGQLIWQGDGKFEDVPLPERREIVRLLLLTEASLQCALMDAEAVYHAQAN